MQANTASGWPSILSMNPHFGLTFLSEAHRAHLSFCSRTSCGSDLQLCSLRNQSRVIDWVSMGVEGPLRTAWPFYSDSIILKSVIVANQFSQDVDREYPLIAVIRTSFFKTLMRTT